MEKLEKAPALVAQEKALEDKNPLKLPVEVDKLYTVKPGIVRIFMDAAGGGLVDLNTISIEKAEKLAKRGILIAKKP